MAAADSLSSLEVIELSDAALDAVRELGCVVVGLPALDVEGFSRSPEEVRGRAIALFAVVGASYGLDRGMALEWLESAGCADHLTMTESLSLQGGAPVVDAQGAVEALWVLAWALRLISAVDWTQPCGDDFVRLFPDPRAGGDVADFCADAVLRSDEALLYELEVAYALHHCWVEHRLLGDVQPSSVNEGVIRWRRHGLEWLASEAGWDDIALDT